jgi:hypothetical protein
MTAVVARFYPAQAVLPDGAGTLRKVYALLAKAGPEAGLWLFQRPDEAAFHAPVDWAATTVPTQRAARNGFDVHLADGRLVVVTAGAGCRCGSLGRWAGPSWARSVSVSS